MATKSEFVVPQQVLLSRRQALFLEEEVLRRKREKITSTDERAHGGNRNLNKGTLIREAIEAHFDIDPTT